MKKVKDMIEVSVAVRSRAISPSPSKPYGIKCPAVKL